MERYRQGGHALELEGRETSTLVSHSQTQISGFLSGLFLLGPGL